MPIVAGGEAVSQWALHRNSPVRHMAVAASHALAAPEESMDPLLGLNAKILGGTGPAKEDLQLQLGADRAAEECGRRRTRDAARSRPAASAG